MSYNNKIGYNDESYDLSSNWDYKKKRIYVMKPLQVNNLNILLLITSILIIFYIPINFCIFNFNIPIIMKEKYNIENSDDSDNRNFCQNSILYILNFKNIYISSIFYIIIFFLIIYILYISHFFTYIYYYIIKPYLSLFIGCSYESIYDFRNTSKNINILIKEKQYKKLYDFFSTIMILLIILLIIIAVTLYFYIMLYNYINNNNDNISIYET